MRRLAACVRVVVCALALSSAGIALARAEASLQEFRARLSPHGRWLVSAQFGTVWQPFEARSGWNPYYDGHWVVTDLGQTWVSDYAWGAVPYHYGTWVMETGRGWVWVPGETWAPSWVVFRSGGDLIGWAPVAPGFVVGGSAASGLQPDVAFVYVPNRQFFAPRIRTCALPASRAATSLESTRIVTAGPRIENQVVVNRGLGVSELRHATGRPVSVVRLESVQGMEPNVRREIRVDESRARRGIRAAEPRMASSGTMVDAPRSGASARPPEPVASRTAYDEVDRTHTSRVAHQDVYDRAEERTAPAQAGVSAKAAAPRGTVKGETQSERDVRLLAAREKQDRARARARAAEASDATRTKSGT